MGQTWYEAYPIQEPLNGNVKTSTAWVQPNSWGASKRSIEASEPGRE